MIEQGGGWREVRFANRVPAVRGGGGAPPMIRRFALFAAGVAIFVSPAGAATTMVWESSTAADFQGGTLEGVVLSSQGRIVAGRGVASYSADPGTAIWSALATTDGRFFFGTSPEGTILELGGVVPKLTTVLDTDQVIVTSLIEGEDHSIYAATVPGGKIYRIAPDGTATTFVKLPDPYIWALVRVGDILYAATGPEGILYEIDAAGRFKVYCDTTEKHLLSLASGAEGTLYAGSDPNGLVYRIDASGKSFVLADLDQTEVRGLAWDGTRLAAAANQSTGFDNVKMVQTLAQSILRETASGKGAEREEMLANLLGGALVSIDADGRVTTLYTAEKDFLTAVATDRGRVLVATGLKGRLIEVVSERENFAMLEEGAGQVLALGTVGGDLSLVGGSGGKVLVVVGPELSAGLGVYTSPVHDAKSPSRWGVSTWVRTEGLEIRLRAGNTPRADDTWADWTGWTAESPFAIDLPRSRYLQYQVRWAGRPEGELRAVRILYSPQNQPPRFTEVNVAKAESNVRPLRKKEASAKIALEWKAEDPNGDALAYRIEYRLEGREAWQRVAPAAGAAPLSEAKYEWNTEAVPDGVYVFRIVASDAADNAGIDELETEWTSRPTLIDNTKPVFEGEVEAAQRVRGRAADLTSPIARLEVSTDAVAWRLVAPADGIYDEPVEEFEFEIGEIEPGFRAVSIRVTDAAGNIGLSRMGIEVE